MGHPLPPLSHVGYIRGAADRVPEALLAIGVPVEILTERDLDAGDLSRYDAILVGSRAYETDPALPRANGRLLDYYLVYFVSVAAVSAVMRLLGKDPLDRKLDREPTWWHPHDPNPLGPQAAARHQF
jgi:hypothetical protein